MVENIDNLFGGEPMEHLVKILQHASPQAIENSLTELFNEYALLHHIVENHGLLNEMNCLNNIKNAKEDLAIRLMSDILSQE